jgi:hypothetical protein
VTHTAASLPEWNVFISYSRRNRRIVKPIVQIVRAVGATAFRDEDSIPPGKKWKVVISESIAACRTVLVFWSAAAAKSRAVKEEYRRAISLGKDVVPLRVDATPLPDELADYQWIDLRPALSPDLDIAIPGTATRLPLPTGLALPLLLNALYRLLPGFLRTVLAALLPLRFDTRGWRSVAAQLQLRIFAQHGVESVTNS